MYVWCHMWLCFHPHRILQYYRHQKMTNDHLLFFYWQERVANSSHHHLTKKIWRNNKSPPLMLFFVFQPLMTEPKIDINRFFSIITKTSPEGKKERELFHFWWKIIFDFWSCWKIFFNTFFCCWKETMQCINNLIVQK